MSKQTGLPPLQITELAVDPADVDRDTYPVTLRLSRPLTLHETQALASIDPSLAVGGDGVVTPDAKLDDVAHSIDGWHATLERAQAIGEELAGEDQVRAAHEATRGSSIGERNPTQYMH